MGVARKNKILFMALAIYFKRPYSAQKDAGYALVKEYAQLHQIKVQNKSSKGHTAILAPEATDDFLQTYEWRKLRMVVIRKRGAKCECCGATPADGVTVINVDHIKPRRKHPELALEESNLQVLCHVCNHGKGNWDQTDWRHPKEVPSHEDELILEWFNKDRVM
jgi:hypothetical protein